MVIIALIAQRATLKCEAIITCNLKDLSMLGGHMGCVATNGVVEKYAVTKTKSFDSTLSVQAKKSSRIMLRQCPGRKTFYCKGL